MAAYHIFIIIAITFLYAPHYANIIRGNSTDDNQCCRYNHGTINCKAGEDCTVICDATTSCYNANIYCPSNYACNIQCLSTNSTIGKETCKLATFHCQGSSECNILCRSDEQQLWACQQAKFNWPTNNQYSLTCSGGRSCYEITVDAPNDNQQFDFNCTGGEGTCFGSTINCPTNADCNIKCFGEYACHSVKVNCPIFADSQCNIECDGLESCQNTKFFGNGTISCTGRRSCVDAQFPIPPPNDNLYVNCLDELSCQNAKITCPTNADCVVTCNGNEACGGADITWPDTGDTSLICDSQSACNGLPDPPSGPKIIGGSTTTTTTTTTTRRPTTSTTSKPYGVDVTISFNYTSNITSSEDIDLIIEMIIANIIENGILNQSLAECGNYKISVNVIQGDDSGQATINATVPLCNQADVSKLVSYFKSQLESDLIQEITNDEDIKLIAIHKVIVKEREIVVIETTAHVILSTRNINASHKKSSNTNLVITMTVIIICLLICIVLLLYFLYKRKRNSKDTKDLERVEQELQDTTPMGMKQTITEGAHNNNNMTANGNDEDEGLYTNHDPQDMITPAGDDDDVFNENEENKQGGTDEEAEDMYLTNDHVTPDRPLQMDTPGQRPRDNTVPDLPPIDNE